MFLIKNFIDVALKSLIRTDADFIVANDLTQITTDKTIAASLVSKNGVVAQSSTKELALTLQSFIHQSKSRNIMKSPFPI